MNTYRLHTNQFTAAIFVVGRTIIMTPPALGRFVTRPIEELLTYAASCNWRLEPILEPASTDWLELYGDLYEIKWNRDHTCVHRVTKHISEDETIDLAWRDLPSEIKMML